MLETLTFTIAPASPPLAPTRSGIEIVMGHEASAVGNNKLWLHGTYQLQAQDTALIKARPLMRALVITWAADGITDTKNLVGDVVLFDDDEMVVNGVHRGYFNYDLTDWLFMYKKESYYITASLGKFISNSLKVVVNPISE